MLEELTELSLLSPEFEYGVQEFKDPQKFPTACKICSNGAALVGRHCCKEPWSEFSGESLAGHPNFAVS